jgi:hypothetical protein
MGRTLVRAAVLAMIVGGVAAGTGGTALAAPGGATPGGAVGGGGTPEGGLLPVGAVSGILPVGK